MRYWQILVNKKVVKLPTVVDFFTTNLSMFVILFYKSKEMHRQARIINFEELEQRIVELKAFENNSYESVFS
ncbi:hypothetical protein [Staphylococcus sp. IVB6240]|uniref:hypothetical protein n=1 Tax=Staphylococcus sp. IVB6240 TaxID=2989771 RepID=UPI0021D14C02|nr:hypothetical protein [Staphylococcus sp. IVB6240]UXR72595.1 hypothetical protein MUA88_05305 [Staphylococcus sp. IVB6240]